MQSTSSSALLRPVEIAGVLSYEMYLFHLPIIGAVVKPFDLWLRDSAHNAVLASYASIALYLVILFATSWTIARYFSEPLNRWIRATLSQREPRTPALPTISEASLTQEAG